MLWFKLLLNAQLCIHSCHGFLATPSKSSNRFPFCRASSARSTNAARIASSPDDTTTITASASSGGSQNSVFPDFFRTDEMQVYIEDTDAYGVVYNSNYLKIFDRALQTRQYKNEAERQSTTAGNENSRVDDEESSHSLPTTIGRSPTNWSIVSVREQLLKASPALGEKYVVEGTRVRGKSLTDGISDIEQKEEEWNLVMKSVEQDSSTDPVVFCVANGVQLSFDASSFREQPSLDERAFFEGASQSFSFQVFRDEFDPYLSTHLPLRSFLNLSERARSNWLGGPANLSKLQQDGGVLVVVASMEDVCLVDYGCNKSSCIRPIQPGDVVKVSTTTISKRRGMLIECHHVATLEGRVIATGLVKLMVLDAKRKRPTNKVPAWFSKMIADANEKSTKE